MAALRVPETPEVALLCVCAPQSYRLRLIPYALLSYFNCEFLLISGYLRASLLPLPFS